MKIAIVGSGLSGILLAHYLESRNTDFTLFHSGNNVSSTVAAGCINPLVFRRMTKSWRVDEFLPFAQNLYEMLEKKLAMEFYIDMPIRRFFASEQEAEEWKKKQDLPDFSMYMYPLSDEDSAFNSSKNNYGTARVKLSSYIDTKVFIQANLEYFESKGNLRCEKFDYSTLDLTTGNYKNEHFDKIIFCEGKDNLYNPWFSKLPVTQTKGEVLTVNFKTQKFDESLNRKCFLLPLKNGTYKIGSTYVWNTDSIEKSEEGKNEILTNLTSLTDEVPEILSHEAGVRPTTLDRRPICGQHPIEKKLFIFNGLGAKGYLIAPKLIQEFGDFLLEGKEMDKEVSINRYLKLFKD